MAGPWHDCRRRSRSAGGWQSARSSRPWEQTSSPITPRGGYHLWLRLPRGTDESEFLSAPLARGTALAPGTYFHADQPDVPRVRLSYAAAPTTADLVTGIHRLEGLV
ncbi:hypothetical protein [Kocuria sp. CPCC 205297]|uniref:hypothetical protein n=1 Tax=Kocuria sp. CPCC 205297 TaxID=3073558 RepID=UPI0034D601C6